MTSDTEFGSSCTMASSKCTHCKHVFQHEPLRGGLESQNLLSDLLELGVNVNERVLAPEPRFAYIRTGFNPELSSDLNLDLRLDLDSNMPVNVEDMIRTESTLI